MIKVCSFNCNSLKNSITEVRELCDINDIIFLQETWLSNFELFMLNKIHDNFLGLGVSAFDSSSALLSGRPFGGVAILWRKSLQCNAKVKIISERIMQVDIFTHIGVVSLLNVYLPTDYRDYESRDQFCMCLGQLACTIDVISSQTNYFGIIGDCNANANGSAFFIELTEFCVEYGLILSDVQFLGSNSSTCTYISASHGTSSWLDHCISSPCLHSTIQRISVNYNICVSDHMPLSVDFLLRLDTFATQDPIVPSPPKPSWDSVTRQQVESYNESVRYKLGTLNSALSFLNDTCVGNCVNPSHLNILSRSYNALTHAITDCGVRCFKHKRSHSSKHPRLVPGWNEHVRVRHEAARRAFLHWKASGSPREGNIAVQMRQTRLSFKYALRKCKRDHDVFKVNKLAVSLLNKDHSRFWTLVKQQMGGGIPLPPSFGNITGNSNIANMWADHFKDILNDSSCESDNDILNQLATGPSVEVPPIDNVDVCGVVAKLRCGKAAGWDHMSAEHLLHLQPDVLSAIAVLLNSILNHGVAPEGLVFSILSPLIKDKNGIVNDKSNYRAIALSTSLSKVLELILVERLQPYLKTSDAQFGFKRNHSTTHATFILKETINHYSKQGSPVYACFLDASKAFDRVCHSKLFQILLERGVPLPYLKLLMHWYRSQKVGVKWANSISYAFSVENGVRQGGNLSPLLFNVYIDDLLHSLRKMHVGCHINNRPVNVLAYADDIVLLSPSRAGLEKLVKHCEMFALSRNVKFNVKKTVCMCFNPRRPYASSHLTSSKPPAVTLSGNKLTWVNQFKYLGHVLDCNLDDSSDMRRIKRSLYYGTNMICALVGHANISILMKLFRSYCTNFYGCELWDTRSVRRSFRELCVAYHSCVKKLAKLPKSSRNHPLCHALKILPCNMLVASRQLSFYRRLLSSDNAIIQTLLTSDVGHNGIIVTTHMAIRQKYEMIPLDLTAASRADILNIFYANLKRKVER